MDLMADELVKNLLGLIEIRFGIYLDTTLGFQRSLKEFERGRTHTKNIVGLDDQELDLRPLFRSKGPPPSDPMEFADRALHSMQQGEWRKNNSPGGINYLVSLENCISDVFNYWNSTKELLEITLDDRENIPVMYYLRQIRNRLQHDLPGNRIVPTSIRKGEPETIELASPLTDYRFPSFCPGESVVLSADDLDGILIEVRTQINQLLGPALDISLPPVSKSGLSLATTR